MNPLLDSHNKLAAENLALKARLDQLLKLMAEMQLENRQMRKQLDGIKICLR